ncbi:MAG: lamin tail domain-containing protein [Desulfobulbales bacterium]|nr:lamin tail domain-containing protein [Desulfobulbales bacterium]
MKKKVLSTCWIAYLLFAAHAGSADVTGDINGDGVVGLEEVIYALQVTSGLRPQLLCGNGVVDAHEECDDGNILDNDGCSGACLLENCIRPAEIVINEIMQDPVSVSDSGGEWFELYNASTQALDLLGCVLSDNGSDSHTIGSSFIIPAAGYAVLARNGDSEMNGGITPDYVYGTDFTLGNQADEIIITCCEIIIDQVLYDGGLSFPDPAGASMSLAGPDLDNSNGLNWCVSGAVYGAGDLGTPGLANDPCAPAD